MEVIIIMVIIIRLIKTRCEYEVQRTVLQRWTSSLLSISSSSSLSFYFLLLYSSSPLSSLVLSSPCLHLRHLLSSFLMHHFLFFSLFVLLITSSLCNVPITIHVISTLALLLHTTREQIVGGKSGEERKLCYRRE